MNKVIVTDYINKYQRNKERSLFIFLILGVCWLTITLSLLLISKRPYLIYLLINIIITILYGFYAVYFFSIIYKLKKETVNFLKKIDNGIIEKEYAVYFKKLDDEKIGNLVIHVYMFNSLDGKERKLRCFDNIEFNNGKYYLETKLDYIISFEAYKYE